MFEKSSGSAIEEGEWGKKFLESIHKEIELMYTTEGPDICFYDPEINQSVYSEDGFAESYEAIIRGAIAGEPNMIYLLAEIMNYSLSDRLKTEIKSALIFLSDDFRNISECELYFRAAKAGSAHAKLWCAFSMDTGKDGFLNDSLSAEIILNSITKFPDTLALSELRFLSYEEDKLYEEAHYVDLDEDTYNYIANPSSFVLYERFEKIIAFMASIGLPYVIDYHFDKIAENKNAWLDWCLKKGIDIKLM